MRICVVDDNPVVSRNIERLVSRSGLRDPKVFNDPATALAWCRINAPSLILLDYHMPGMNGLEFLQALRTEPRCAEVVVAMFTGWATEVFRALAQKAGVSEVIEKPVVPLEFERKLRALREEVQRRLARSRPLSAVEGSSAALDAPVGGGELFFLEAKIPADGRPPTFRN